MGYIVTKNELIQLIYRVGFVNSNYNFFFVGGRGLGGLCTHRKSIFGSSSSRIHFWMEPLLTICGELLSFLFLFFGYLLIQLSELERPIDSCFNMWLWHFPITFFAQLHIFLGAYLVNVNFWGLVRRYKWMNLSTQTLQLGEQITSYFLHKKIKYIRRVQKGCVILIHRTFFFISSNVFDHLRELWGYICTIHNLFPMYSFFFFDK